MTGYMLTERAARTTAEVCRKVNGVKSEVPKRKGPQPEMAIGGCDTQDAIIHVTIFGKPTGGTQPLTFTVNAVTTPVTFNYNDSAATAKSTLVAGHSEVTSSDVTVTGGPWPNATMVFHFTGARAATDILPPSSDWGSLTGGSGIGIISSLAQKGHS